VDTGLVADLVLYLHFAIVIFLFGGEIAVLAGGFFHWNWVRNRILRFTHLALMGFVAFEAAAGIWCPLTLIEYDLRVQAGQAEMKNVPFVAGLLRTIIFYDFPPWAFTVAYIGFFFLLVLTLRIVPIEETKNKKKRSSD
jgi:hypothetical protein